MKYAMMNQILCAPPVKSGQSARHPDGLIILNKPKGPTSAACLNRIKSRFELKKVGHAGTLDPMATGILVVLVGQATKLASYVTEGPKTYLGTILLGFSTDTYDMQGKILQRKDCSEVSAQQIVEEIKSWENLSEQPVPPVSAAKHMGRPFHAIIRAGQKVPHKTKKINIYRTETILIDSASVMFRITCSAGTYVRSLAHSLGIRLGCGAALAELVREQSHPFALDQAVDLEELLESGDLEKHLLPISKALSNWPQVTLNEIQERFIRNGRPVEADNPEDYLLRENDPVLLLSEHGTPVALAEAKFRDGRLMWSIIRGLWA